MEKRFVDWLEQHYAHDELPVRLGIGDDAAIVQFPGDAVVSTDSISEGTHFLLDQHSLQQVGHKAIAVNLSDLAAMGAKPVAATINFTCPNAFELTQLQELFTGIANTAERYGVQIIGGDTNRWDGKLVVGVTAFGTRHPNANGEFWKMNGAKPGDAILVTGSLGGSILRKHIEFEPRLAATSYLAEHYQIHAATDITDSLTVDLASVAKKSECGFELIAKQIPISSDAETIALQSQKTPLSHALYDGEDFELILCVAESEAERMLSDPKFDCQITEIGRMNDSGKYNMKSADGVTTELKIEGFEH